MQIERMGLSAKYCFQRRGVSSATRLAGCMADALQHIDQIGVRIDAVQSAGDDQALDDTDVFGAELGPAEEPRFSAHGNHTQGSLEMIGIDRNIRIGEKDFEPERRSRT